MNQVILSGRLTADPEIRYTQEQMAVAQYTLAVDRFGKNKDADFIRCVAFDKKAQFAEKYLTKGMKIMVSGRIQTGSYTNRDGQKVYTTDVIVNEQEFAEKKASSDETVNTQPAPEKMPESANNEFMSLPDDFDGLPFK